MGMPTSDPKSPTGPRSETSDPCNSTTGTAPEPPAREIGGRGGPEPTRYGDWEKNGRCIDF
jgi:hypothetical protein